MINKIKQTFLNDLLAMVILLAILSSVGCGPAGLREPITKFQASSAVVIASTRLYVTDLNQVERDHYVNVQLSKKAQIKLDELEAVQVFSHDGLKARLDALAQLSSYGDLLAKLANSDGPEKAEAEAKNLGESIKNLSTTVNGLTGADDTAFKAAVEPVSIIVGEILNSVLQHKIKEALNKAINEGEVPVNNLIAAIRNDIAIAYQRKRSSLSDMRVVLVDEYNTEMLKGVGTDSNKLRVFADRIREHENRWEVFASANPEEGLDAMAKAHSALVTYAKSGQKVRDLSSLVSAMEDFASRAKIIGQAVQELREI